MAAEVNEDECTACGSCVDECPEEAITLEDDVAKIDKKKCSECGVCVEECPVDAITL